MELISTIAKVGSDAFSMSIDYMTVLDAGGTGIG
jgi:hypothetical protein